MQLEIRKQSKHQHTLFRFQNVKEHGELAAALLSGILIAAGWLCSGHETLSIALFLSAFCIGGFAKAKEGILETLSEKTLNVELLMIFAAVGSALIGYWAEGAILIFIFSLSGALETYTLNKSKRDLTSLMKLEPEEAVLLDGAGQRKVAAAELKAGDLIMVKPGERVAADGDIESGQTSIDESALTGESIPVEKTAGDPVFAGTVNLNGSLTVRVKKANEDSLFKKIIKLVESAQNSVSPSQAFIERFENMYVKGVLLAVGLLLFLPHYLLGWSWSETFYRAMVFMVVASPCALVASIMPAALSLISNGARNGLLVKGSVFLEKLGNSKIVAMDKTGTITNGKPAVENMILAEGMDENEYLEAAAAIEKQSNHPLAKAIVEFAEAKGIHPPGNVAIEETSGFGVKAQFEGEIWFIGKAGFVGEEEADHVFGDAVQQLVGQGKTIVYVKKGGRLAGCFALKDQIRPEAKAVISELNSLGIQTAMLTGDQPETAAAIAEEAGLKIVVSECLPDSKVKEAEQLKRTNGTIVMVGDGINDAPALAAADVGVAMGEGTDVALETADIVLMKNDLTGLTKMIRLSRKMNRIIKQNVVFSLAVICLLICSNFLQILDLPLGVIGHEGSTLLVILNGLRLLKS
ncbi:heavy metal translocating P-type ATPase [Bacillus sonorensis]|uniref:heavy metal translocating P-type ATPase n=2 Tax=Bacillus sonorensis TaxID=119858 RepID=UPI001F020AB2|nr:heavy metal translocating P-type ATPase [Bacillus sonorensis]MCF7619117.1 cadmium-translocating P-type ATPase [Bacillus sonorensis]MCY7855481.1 cadmium-translocating P-type ATPase [Bacillus sonorensis]MEC1353084.1 heavy metal translocating P-type ATPase [Bacillus sonorensis]MEC1428267.1 heavy metal translocating P-type ATPase [Bacillus sonorensis]MEC1441120.1 heavy metal translocating P-type ATPase [Bacillus sonorensis]